ncbi:MAG: isovaleryl-CoA dehydrogenase [Nannocystales bacterium]
MTSHAPHIVLPTHQVENQAPELPAFDLYSADLPLREAVTREGGGWSEDRLIALGTELGTPEMFHRGHLANKHAPELQTFDRFGHRIDEVEFHPAYHELMDLAARHQLPTLPWKEPKPGANVARTAMMYLMTQVEAGVLCPVSMTYAVVPALMNQPDVAKVWLPRVLSGEYDPRMIPAEQKRGVTFGMAMTEKQGGSDVRANSTVARPLGAGGPGGEYSLTGHKWFCSAPMSDAFLTLANTERGLSCFLVPRFRPDGTRNAIFVQRLKNKLGNRSNASSEIEYHDAWAQMVGEEGKGVRTIVAMVHHTRLDAGCTPVGMMRQALTRAVHHVRHRAAFGKPLIEQPLMRNVLADVALDLEGCTAMSFRIARSFDESADEDQARFGRLATAVNKFWTNKRCPQLVYECLECHGGAGYIEESVMPRLFRESPLNSIWEGSGNVICLDVLRALHRDPGCFDVFVSEVEDAAPGDPDITAKLSEVKAMLADQGSLEPRARRLTEDLALLLQASLLRKHAPTAVADAFVQARLQTQGGAAYGTLPTGIDEALLIERATPPA